MIYSCGRITGNISGILRWSQYDGSGAEFTVTAPENAQGITATVSGDGAKVSYDSTVLAVENFETRKISPMAAPYLLGSGVGAGLYRLHRNGRRPGECNVYPGLWQ